MSFTDYLEGPVPFFHEFFDAAKNTLDEDFPAPGTWSVARDESLLLAAGEGDGKKGGKKWTFDMAFEQEDGKLTKAELRHKMRLHDDSVFLQVTFNKEGGGPLGIGAYPALQFVCTQSQHALTVATNQLLYQFTHPTFSVHARSNFLEGGLPIHASVATCIAPGVYGGFCVDYDALRSGLRSSVAAGQYCSADGGSIATVSVDGRWNPGFTLSHCVGDKVRLLANVLPWGNEADRAVVAGVEYLAHDNNAVLLRGDWYKKLVSLAAAFDWTGWRIGVSASWSVAPDEKGKYDPVPRMGLSFNA
jgi:hypothetical protein